MISAIEKLTEDMRNRVRLMVGRAVLSVISDSTAIQTAQARLLADEVQDDVERVQEYGFTSVPQPGAEAVIAFVGGNRDHGLIIAVDDRRYRLKGLAGGEVALYDDLGQKVHLTRSGIVINAPQVSMSGDLLVAGSIVAQGDISDHGDKSMAGMRTVFNNHTHTDPQGGNTGTPLASM